MDAEDFFCHRVYKNDTVLENGSSNAAVKNMKFEIKEGYEINRKVFRHSEEGFQLRR